MKKTVSLTAAILFGILFLLTVSAEAATPSSFTSLRGGVYNDSDGDGRCDDKIALPGVDLVFSRGVIQIPLKSGVDGTFGIVALGPGLWEVRLVLPAGWSATSSLSKSYNVGLDRQQIITDINFCLQQVDDAVADSTPSTVGGRDLIARLVAKNLKIPAANDYSDDAAEMRGAISEEILTNPEPAPISEVRQMALTSDMEPELISEPWLDYLNRFRQVAGMPLLQEDLSLSLGARLHSRYMVVNDRPIAHSQDASNPLFDTIGAKAAQNSNIFATTQLEATYIWATNFWISAPFHLVPILDPTMNRVGYGQYNQDVGNFKMSAVLDVLSSRGTVLPSSVQYPIMFPDDGSETWVVRHSLYEWPDPLKSCAGYSRPTGAPIVLQVSNGSGSPRIDSYSLSSNGQPIIACAFSERNYSNSDVSAQRTGRLILDERDAVILIPRKPLAIGQTYQVEVVVDGQSYSWEFSTISPP